jgi:hypothetical protein
MKGLPELKQNPRLCEYFDNFVLNPVESSQVFTKESILTVASAFWDLSQSYHVAWSIAMALKHESLYEDAMVQTKIGLGLATNDKERYFLYCSMGDTLLELRTRLVGDDETKAAYLTEACETLAKAVAINSAESITPQSDEDTRLSCANTYMDSALAEFLRGDIDKMNTLVKGAVSVPVIGMDVTRLLDQIIGAEAWPVALTVLKLFKKVDRTWYLDYIKETVHIALQKSAVELNKAEQIIEMYSESVVFLEQGGFGGYLRLYWADFHKKVLGEPAKAKEILYGLLNYIRVVSPEGYDWPLVPVIIWRIVDILVEEFRNTTNPNIKTTALDELKSVILRLKETQGEDFDCSQSQTTIPLALMTRKLGPAVQFEELLKTTFDGCIADLSDNESWKYVFLLFLSVSYELGITIFVPGRLRVFRSSSYDFGL